MFMVWVNRQNYKTKKNKTESKIFFGTFALIDPYTYGKHKK